MIDRLINLVGYTPDTELSTDLDRIRHLPEGPLKMTKFGLWWLRKTVFTKPKPTNPAIFVELTEPEIVALLGRHHFEPNWELSYSYRNETLNIRRVVYDSDHRQGYEWWQVHIRGYRREAGDPFDDPTFELAAHFELEPTEHPKGHVDHVGLEIERGARAVMDLFDELDVAYRLAYPDGRPATFDEGTPQNTVIDDTPSSVA